MKIYGETNIGLVRASNQDNYYISPDEGWAVVADGMGGHNGGETASEMTVNIVKTAMEKKLGLRKAIEDANSEVFNKSYTDSELLGMGTTVVLCSIKNSKAEIAHVGDSRAYIIHENEIKQITKDHSIVQQLIDSGTITREQAMYHPQRNLITRAVGTEKDIDIDFDIVDFVENDVILICTDGLSSYVDEKDIRDIVLQNNPSEAVKMLVDAANNNGGRDNVTVVLIKA